MKIAYVYEYDARNPSTQSSRPFSILKELQDRHHVVSFFPIPNISRKLLAPRKIYHALRGKQHHLEREWLTLHEYAWRAEKFLDKEKPDIVFAPSQIVPTYINTKADIIYCNDAPFGAMIGYYPGFSNCSVAYSRQGFAQEKQSHKNATRIVYPSAWARDAAIRLHGAMPEKCLEQPFGANLPYEPSWTEIKSHRNHRRDSLKLLFICSNWIRKDGDFAVAIVIELRKRGLNASLQVIGKAPPQSSEAVHCHGYINKWDGQGAIEFKNAMYDADFLIMPSKAEAYGMSLWEGAAHGLPMIGRATGGIPSIIRHDKTGMLFSMDATPSAVADWIQSATSETTYLRLSEAAYVDFRERGNWRTFVERVF